MSTERLVIEVRENGSREVQRNITGIGDVSTKAHSNVTMLTKALGAIGGALALRSAISTIASFQQEMSNVAAVSDATGEQFARLTARARELGATTRYSATESARGIAELAKAGFSVEKAYATVDDTLLLAQAGGFELGKAAEIVSATINGFHMSTDDATRIVDVFAKAANMAATDVTDIGVAMRYVGAVANAMGLSVEQTTAALSALSDANLKGSQGGTGLRNVLSHLEAQTSQFTKILKTFGIEGKEVQITQVGLVAALERLRDAGIGAQEAMMLFGEKGGPAFLNLVGAIPKIKAFEEGLNAAGGTGKRIATVMDANMNGAIKRVKSSLEAIILSLSDTGGAGKYLEAIIRGLASTLTFLADHTWILSGALVGLAASGIPAVIAAVKYLWALFHMHPIGLIVIALGAAIGAFIEFRAEIAAFGVSVLQTLRGPITFINMMAGTVWSLVVGVWGAVKTLAGQAPAAIGDLLIAGVTLVLKGIQWLIKQGIEGINFLLTKFRQTSYALTGSYPEWSKNFVVEFEKIEMPTMTAASNFGTGAGDAFVDGFTKTMKASEERINGFFEGLQKSGDLAAAESGNRAGREAVAQVEDKLKGSTKPTEAEEIMSKELSDKDQLLASINEKEKQRADTQRYLNELLAEGSITQRTYNEHMLDMDARIETLSGGLEAFKMKLAEVDVSLGAMGATLGEGLVNALDRGTAAFAEFAMSGFRSVSELKSALAGIFSDIAKMILQMIMKLLIVKALEATIGAFGGGGGAGGAIAQGAVGAINMGAEAALTGRAGGGPVVGGRDYLVGENGPEIFRAPMGGGNIVPNGETRSAERPVNVNIVNVTDPDDVTAALGTSAGEKAIMNVLSKHKTALKGMMS